MNTFSKIAVAAVTISALAFTGCKKGEGDPFLSLSSRKARLAGEWKVTKGEGTETNTLGNITSTTTTTYDGSTQVETTGSSNNTDHYTLEYTFEKDGNFSSVYTNTDANPAQVTTTNGTWNFTGGIGETKNKSQIVMYTESQTTGNSTATYEGANRPTSIMDIYQLKGKEIIFKQTYSDSNGNTSQTGEMTWTLEPK
jgi:hypothetical protein